LAPVAKEYPDVAFILGHSGGTPAGYVEAIEVAQRHDNIYLDLCRSEMSPVWVERLVSEVGADRVLWGTDFPFLEPRYLVGRLACTTLSDQEKRQVFGESAARLLHGRDIAP
jgi:predicted TIM-barrel fold metal-dependent hydrolase